jgi:hypothetical protein
MLRNSSVLCHIDRAAALPGLLTWTSVDWSTRNYGPLQFSILKDKGHCDPGPAQWLSLGDPVVQPTSLAPSAVSPCVSGSKGKLSVRKVLEEIPETEIAESPVSGREEDEGPSKGRSLIESAEIAQ